VSAFAAALLASCSNAPKERVLTVCADPNNLPFSNRAGEGFENRIAERVASALHARLDYVWWAQRRGYVRNTLGERKCDLWPGVASGVEMVATTRPYYRSTYMFVTRADRPLSGLTLDDPRLRTLKLGVQLVGDDAMNTPPAHALARRGITSNIKGYMLYGDYSRPNPPAAVVEAVEKGDVDAALVWGPLAGWSASRSNVELRIEPVTPWLDDAQWPMTYDISMGVRRGDPALLREIEQALAAQAKPIAAILEDYHVPLAAN
jgi:mxaJ protein